MAAGVGKTFRMLQEGHAEAEAGRDVVIGLLEAHGRAATIAQAQGLERLARRRIVYRNTTLEELDVDGVLRRAPELALVDELAHTNAPGMEHHKRYEDIEDLLAGAVDVYSTVNVQHLESLNDQIAELTGVRVRETVPDSALARADEVVIIDITPEALLDRVRAGKVYAGEARIGSALNNFFRIENLAALREVALRQVAQDVEAKRLVRETVPSREPDPAREKVRDASSRAVGERLLALVTPRPRSQRVVRRAWRSAQRLGAELDLLWVSGERVGEQEREQLEALRRLASVLGAHLLVERGDDVADVVRRIAGERGTTYVLMGTPSPRGPLRRLMTPALPYRLLRELPGIDLRIVADRTTREEADS
jgi:two-component system, OmpR family, sensor histidine kinase KdpD